MSEERGSRASSGNARVRRGNDVGVGASGQNVLASLRAGTVLMKGVSIFLMHGRKASVNAKGQTCVDPKHESRGNRRKRTQNPAAGTISRNSARTMKLMESLRRKTRFSWSELETLRKLYDKLINSGQQQVGQSIVIGKQPRSNQTTENSHQGIDRTIFRELLHNTFKVITDDSLVERIFCCWDRENEGILRFEQWIMGLDLYLRGSLGEKIEFCFKVYDLNNDGFVTKDEIFQLFKNCLMKQPGEEDPEESVRDLSELTLKRLDVDRDGKISYQDFKTSVTEEPLLLEAFGQCLPTDETCVSIRSTLQ